MVSKTFWSTVIVLMVAAMLLAASCGPKTTTTPTPTITSTPAPAPASTPAAPAPTPTPAPAPSTETPKYGGTLTDIERLDLQSFDPIVTKRGFDNPPGSGLIYEQMIAANWAKGLAGTGEIDFGTGRSGAEFFAPQLAESYEMPELGTYIIKIRRGVHFALNPASEASRLVNGREFTADDAVWNFEYLNHTPNAYVYLWEPGAAKNMTVEKTGPWEVTLKTPVDAMAGWFWILWGGNNQHHLAPEVVKKYGNAQDWHNVVGTGPWMLTDFLSGSAATLTRNPNYWGKDPVGPGKGNQIPYVDTIKRLVIPDLSTRLAVMRTGKADWVADIAWEDALGLIKTSPAIKYKKYLGATLAMKMRSDKADLPFKDKRVRYALMMATDFEALKNGLYGGQAEILASLVTPMYPNLYTLMEKLPESVQTLYKYNPEKAKQLLADAGYPKGFNTKVIVESTSQSLDLAAAFKSMWAKVGVNLEIQPRESGIYTNIVWAPGATEEMLLSSSWVTVSFSSYPSLMGMTGAAVGNIGHFNDPPGSDTVTEKAYQEMQKNVLINWPKVEQTFREFAPYFLEQANWVPSPAPYTYRFWQPWVKNYYGENTLGVFGKYVWIDQDLKETMTGRR